MALTRVLSDLRDTYPLPAICDSISSQFNGSNQIFPLSLDGVTINTITDSRQVQISVNGQLLRPYTIDRELPWMTEYDISGDYRITSDGNIIIYNPPDLGDQASVVLVTYGTYVQRRLNSYTPTMIAFGE
jgi:hypothetical protein